MNSKNLKNCAILSMDQLDDFENYDHLLDEPLAGLGWKTHLVSWRNESIDWNQFDVVVIRSTWDYQDDPELFIQQLKRIDQSSARLENPLQLVLWNINKQYLKELESKGARIVPTLWGENLNRVELLSFFQQLQADEIVIKPVISANADNTFRLKIRQAENLTEKLVTIFSTKDYMVQPFMHSIITEGEFSLFFFGSEYSHAILKKPKQNDFRVQEEHGGTLLKIEPEKELLQQAIELNHKLYPAPLYSRLDFVRTQSGFAVMEVELIEPSLYFNMDQLSAERFAKAFDKWVTKNSTSSV